MKRLILPGLAALSLAACATPPLTAYQPAAGPQGAGFSESRIETCPRGAPSPPWQVTRRRPGSMRDSHGAGFSESRIEPGRYRLTFHGGGGAPRGQVSDYALR